MAVAILDSIHAVPSTHDMQRLFRRLLPRLVSYLRTREAFRNRAAMEAVSAMEPPRLSNSDDETTLFSEKAHDPIDDYENDDDHKLVEEERQHRATVDDGFDWDQVCCDNFCVIPCKRSTYYMCVSFLYFALMMAAWFGVPGFLRTLRQAMVNRDTDNAESAQMENFESFHDIGWWAMEVIGLHQALDKHGWFFHLMLALVSITFFIVCLSGMIGAAMDRNTAPMKAFFIIHFASFVVNACTMFPMQPGIVNRGALSILYFGGVTVPRAEPLFLARLTWFALIMIELHRYRQLVKQRRARQEDDSTDASKELRRNEDERNHSAGHARVHTRVALQRAAREASRQRHPDTACSKVPSWGVVLSTSACVVLTVFVLATHLAYSSACIVMFSVALIMHYLPTVNLFEGEIARHLPGDTERTPVLANNTANDTNNKQPFEIGDDLEPDDEEDI